MALTYLSPEGYIASGLATIAVLGAPDAIYNGSDGTRQLTMEGIERATIAAGVISRTASPGSLILHAGYGGGYKKGGPTPASYAETEAHAYEAAVRTNLSAQYGLDLEETGWEVLPGENSNDSFDPSDFSSSTAEEAFLIDRTHQRLGNTGILGVVGGPRQLQRLADAADAMQLSISNNMVGIATSGLGENNLREYLTRMAYRRAVLQGEQAPEAVLAYEQAFFQANVLGKAAFIVLGSLHSYHSLALPPLT
jgi:hypothetical protein